MLENMHISEMHGTYNLKTEEKNLLPKFSLGQRNNMC